MGLSDCPPINATKLAKSDRLYFPQNYVTTNDHQSSCPGVDSPKKSPMARGSNIRVSFQSGSLVCALPVPAYNPGVAQFGGKLEPIDTVKLNQLSLKTATRVTQDECSTLTGLLSRVNETFCQQMEACLNGGQFWPGLLVVYKNDGIIFECIPTCLTSTINNIQCQLPPDVLAAFLVMTGPQAYSRIAAIPLSDVAPTPVAACLNAVGYDVGLIAGPSTSQPWQSLLISVSGSSMVDGEHECDQNKQVTSEKPDQGVESECVAKKTDCATPTDKNKNVPSTKVPGLTEDGNNKRINFSNGDGPKGW